MTKKEFIEKTADYANYASGFDFRQVGVNNGSIGRLAEAVAKIGFKNCRGRLVSAQGQVDTCKNVNGKRCTFEIKTGSGELATLNPDGSIKKSIFGNDYIVYCYRLEIDFSTDFSEIVEQIIEQLYIINMNDFKDLLDDLNLIGAKYSSAMTKKPAPQRYYDKLSIKSMSAAKRTKCRENFINEYETIGTPFVEFFGIE